MEQNIVLLFENLSFVHLKKDVFSHILSLMTQEKHEKYQLPPEVMKKAVKGITYISHPLRLRILPRPLR